MDMPLAGCLIEALTGNAAKDAVCWENLSIVGNSFLKFAASVRAFYALPQCAEQGALTAEKMQLTCGSNLACIGLQMCLKRYLRTEEFHPAEGFIPPGYVKLATDRVSWSSF